MMQAQQVHMGIELGPNVYKVVPHLHCVGQYMYLIVLGV